MDYKNTGVKCIIPEVGTLETLESQKFIDLSPGAAQEIEAFLPSTNTNRKKRKRQGDDGEQKSSKQQKKSTLQPLSRDDIVAGKYKIQKKLGEGTFSVVYVVFEAWCPSAIISIVSLYHVSITSLKSQLSIFTLCRLRHRPTRRSNVTKHRYSALNIEKNFEEVALKIDKGSSVCGRRREVQILKHLRWKLFIPKYKSLLWIRSTERSL